MSWICSDCSLRVSYLPDFEAPELPAGWVSSNGSLLCLRCGRDRAVAAALAEAEASGVPQAKLGGVRARALAAFELERDSDRSDGQIAKSLGGMPSTVVAKVRAAR